MMGGTENPIHVMRQEGTEWHEALSDIQLIEGRYYILAASSLADDQNRVLKHGDTFAVFDHYGDIKPVGLGEEGVYFEGTRYLSSFLLRLGRDRPLFLSSTVRDDNAVMAADLTNPDMEGEVTIPRGTVHVARTKFLWDGACYERLRIRNYGLSNVSVNLSLYFDADFADIFEVRGLHRKRRGQRLPTSVNENEVVLRYTGLDNQERRTRLVFTPAPSQLSESQARFDLALEPQAEAVYELVISCEAVQGVTRCTSYGQAFQVASKALQEALARTCEIRTSNAQFNSWIRRSRADIHMMITDTPSGPYPYAGVPWFSTAFGRDGIITAWECLWLYPEIGKGVLTFLAQTQAREIIPAQEAEPGRILHETRKGEMAALGEIPFGLYYGSIDSTPLFVMLAEAYYQRTSDGAFIEQIWENIELALNWVETRGDTDSDGFIEYARRTPDGLIQQGWKDSHDSVFHSDGTMAQGPIALCEVQGYVYAARRAAARLARVIGKMDRAQALDEQAAKLHKQFNEVFWCEELGMYALALDGEKRLCRVRSSNAGHCLFAGIATPEYAKRTAESLLAEDMFSGWGIRTLSASEARYNPMSYHNGSIWPHDNALIADGFARYGLKDAALTILEGLFETSLSVDLHRLPELFCGFPRMPKSSPTLYPVACAPQSWAAASVYLLLQSVLGLSIDAATMTVRLHQPSLPAFLEHVVIRDLRVGTALIDLQLHRYGRDVGVNVLRREGDVSVVVLK